MLSQDIVRRRIHYAAVSGSQNEWQGRYFDSGWARCRGTKMVESEAKRILQGLLESAVRSSQAGQHILLCGKASLCRNAFLAVVSVVEGVTLRSPLVSTLERAGDMAATLSTLKSGSFLFIDDLHRLSKPPGEILAQAMDGFWLHIEVGPRLKRKTIDLVLPQFTLIGATSQPHLLTLTLKKCFKQQIWIDDDTDSPTATRVVVQ